APVGPGVGSGVVVFREVVDIGGVDHAVGRGRAAAQAVEVLKGAAVHASAGGRQGRGGVVRTAQAGDLMAGVDKVADDGGADETRRAGNENTHDALLPDGPASGTRPVLPGCARRPCPVQDLFRTRRYVSGITAAHVDLPAVGSTMASCLI